jgi:hypothetical protein
MERCPSCSQISVPGWRKSPFTRTDRFKCRACAVWLQYEKAKSPAPGLLHKIGNPLLRAIVAVGLLQIFMIAFAFVGAYVKCILAYVPFRWLLPSMVTAIVGVIVVSERSILKRLRLVVAERQEPKLYLDPARAFRALMADGNAQKSIGLSLAYVAMLLGCFLVTRPIIIAIAKVMPIACACATAERTLAGTPVRCLRRSVAYWMVWCPVAPGRDMGQATCTMPFGEGVLPATS